MWIEIYGAEGTRTLDPLRAKQVLSQLSYRPKVDVPQQNNTVSDQLGTG